MREIGVHDGDEPSSRLCGSGEYRACEPRLARTLHQADP